MLKWLILSIILAIITGVLTIIWWRVGDIWADEEHKRFKAGDEHHPSGATVIRGFDKPETKPTPDDETGQG